MKFTIRCSSLPMAFVCPGSVRRGDVLIDPVCEPADQGSAAHEAMQAIVEMDLKSIDDIDLVGIARKWSADPDELKIQAFIGLKIWKDVRQWFPNAQAEVNLQQEFDLGGDVVLELTGHLDAMSIDLRARAGRFGDWKFGRVDKNHSHQVKGYGTLQLANYADIDKALGFVGWALGSEPGGGPDIEDYSMTRDQMWEWLDEVKKRIVEWDGVFHPGQQCAFCQRNHDCPAMLAMARRDVLVLGGAEMAERIAGGLQDMPNAELIALDRRARVLTRVIESLRAVVKQRVEAAGGCLPDGDGRELRFVNIPHRVIDPILSRLVLEERLSKEAIAACTKIGARDLDNAVAKKAERGGKKAAIKELDDALRAAGAITEEMTRKLMDVRTKGG